MNVSGAIADRPAIEISLRWPVPTHGSLVITTSPGLRRSGGIFRKTSDRVCGSVPMKLGILRLDWVNCRPRPSNRLKAMS